MSVTRQDNQSGSGVPPLNKENKQSRDGSAILAAPTGQDNVAQGKERSDAALGHASQNTPSPERAKVSDTLPVGWEWKTVGEMVAEMQYGTSAKTSEDATGVPVLRMGNIKDGNLVLDSLKYLPANHEEFPALLLQDGDLLFNRTNSAELVGKSAVYRGNPSPSSCASYLIRARLRPDYVPEFLAYYINSTFGRAWVSSVVSQQVGQANVNGTKLKALSVPVPSFAEQRKIVAEIEKQFTRLEAGVAALRRVQANLKRYRAAVLKAASEGRLVPTEAELAKVKAQSGSGVPPLKQSRDGSATLSATFETGEQLLQRILAERRKSWTGRGKYKEPAAPNTANLPPLASGWTWASVEQISTKVVDGVHKKPTYVPSGIPFVTVRNLTAGPGISFDRLNYVTLQDHEEFIKRANPEPGDVLVSKDGTLGVIRVIKTDVKFSIFVSVAMVKPVIREMSNFLGMALSAPQVQAQMVPKGSGLQHIHLEDLREDCIPLPSLAEQTRIVAEVERRLSVVEELESVVSANLQRAARLRQSILQKAFTRKMTQV